MQQQKIILGGLAVLMLVAYNGAQSGLSDMRNMSPLVPANASEEELKQVNNVIRKQRYGPSLEWLNRVMRGSAEAGTIGQAGASGIQTPKLDFRMLSSLMVAGLASGFKSQVANLLWMKSDEYWHKGMLTRQNPIMEAVVTLDPQFIEAWDTAGWHWAYNIYADLPNRTDLATTDPKLSEAEKEKREKELRKEQDRAVNVGLDYYARGTEMNPDKYLLWFKYGWTRAEKFGYNDEKTVDLYRTARKQPDARLQEITVPDQKTGKPKQQTVEGIDLMGRTIGHAYERMPNIAKALETYGDDLLKLKDKPEKKALLMEAGRDWARYSSLYTDIVNAYRNGDAVTKAQVKKIVPDVERMVAAHQMREEMSRGEGSQPTGAFVSIVARYLPAWNLWQAGKLDEAARQLIGVMNADPKYHLQGLPITKRIWELQGLSPDAIKAQEQEQRDYERQSSQEMGLHMLASIFETKMNQEQDPMRKKAWARLAFETWYRARERDSLNFQARRRTLFFQDQYGFTAPQEVIAQVKASRSKGSVIASPTAMPNIEDYVKKVSSKQEEETPATPTATTEPVAAPAEAPGHEGHAH